MKGRNARAWLPLVLLALPLLFVGLNGGCSTTKDHSATATLSATQFYSPTPSVTVASSGKVLVANYSSGSISVIDVATRQVVGTIIVGGNPFGVAIAPGGSFAFVSDTLNNKIAVVNIPSLIAPPGGPIPTAIPTGAFTVSPTFTNTASATLTATCPGCPTLTPTPWVFQYGTGLMPMGVAMSPNGTFAYTCNYGSNSVTVASVILSNCFVAPVATVVVGTNPIGLSVGPGGSFVYVSNHGTANLSVIRTSSNSVVATISLAPGACPHDCHDVTRFSGNYLFVTDDCSTLVPVVDTSTNVVVATITVGSGPHCFAVAPNGSRIYVANTNAGTVSVVDAVTNANLATVSVGPSPFGAHVTSDSAYVFVTNGTSGNVSVISSGSNTVVATIPVGGGPTGISIYP